MMKNKNVLKSCLNAIASLALVIAVSEASAGCPFMLYQPKIPAEVMKLRKRP